MFNIVGYSIPDVIVFCNNKIKNYKEIEEQGNFKSVDWQEKINRLQHLINELALLYGNPPSNNLRFESLVWCSNKAVVSNSLTVNEITEALDEGVWYCLPVENFDGHYYLSKENQDTLNYYRKIGKLEEIFNEHN